MSKVQANFPKKLEVLFRPSRYKVLYGGRGAGRSWGVARALLIIGTKRSIRVLCARELQKSISESVHQVLSEQISHLGLDAFYTAQKDEIFGKNGTQFFFEGIRNNVTKIKSYEGIDYCWVEEAQGVSKRSWGILIPTVRKEGSEIWITFNPDLEEDYTYQRFVKEADPSSCIVVKMTYLDNPYFPQVLREEMERDKVRDPDYYLNVWEGECRLNLEGAVYAKELRRAQQEGRLSGKVRWDREWPVDVFFDLGRANATAMWFAQRVSMENRILAYFQDTGEDITYYLREMQSRGYVYGTIWLPHDAKAKRLGSKRTIEEIVRQAGYKVRIVPRQSITDGINAARIILPNCYFDEEECEEGIRALRHYRYEVTNGQLSDNPLHDWASDGADAFRYLAIALTGYKGDEVSVVNKIKMLMQREDREFTYGDHRRGGVKLNWMEH